MLVTFQNEEEEKEISSVFGCYVGSTVSVDCDAVDSSRSAQTLQALLAHALTNKEFQKLVKTMSIDDPMPQPKNQGKITVPIGYGYFYSYVNEY